jgi:hypothetical protein
MKHPFKLSKSNIIYAIIVGVIVIFLNTRTYGLDGFSIGYTLGSLIGLLVFPALLAFLFWYILGRKEKGGTTTFNVVLSLMLLSSISQFGRTAKERQKPIDTIQKAITDYKENTLANPDSTDLNYAALSSDIKRSIDDLVKTSIGEERKLYVVVKEFFKKSDSTSLEWNKAYNAFNEPRILDFNQLNNQEEYEFQKSVIQTYIDQSQNFKYFIENRIDYMKNHSKNIDKSHTAYIGFMKGMVKKDSVQTPIFLPYINGHIAYGEGIKEIVEILEKESGKWEYENETLIFENSESQILYETILNKAFGNEELVNELSDKLIEIL